MNHCFTTFLLGTCLTMSMQAQTVIFQEDFEKSSAPGKTEIYSTGGAFDIASFGKDSGKSLRAVKPDTCGFFSSQYLFDIPEASRGHVLLTTFDLKTEQLGANSEYFMMISQLAKGKANGANLFFAYDDGLVRQSNFGGQYKTPQTSGNWKQSRHQFQLRPETDQIRLSLVVREGNQVIFFDNITVTDVGMAQLPAQPPLILSQKVDWPYAMVDLEDIVPGAVYQIEANVSWPDATQPVGGLTPGAQTSTKTAPADLAGMGISMVAIALDGKPMPPVQLMPVLQEKNHAVYRMTVPETAVKVELNFHNDDLIRFDHNQIYTQARRWQEIAVKLDNYGEIAADNAFYQYIYREKQPKLKVRNWMEPGPFELDVLRRTLSEKDSKTLEIVKENGGMCFKLNGKLIPPMALSYNGDQAQYRWCDLPSAQGPKVIFARSPYGGVAMDGTWTGEGKYDFANLDRNIYNILLQNPDAAVILSIDSVYPPSWWAEANQDELLRDQDGNFVWSYGGFLYTCRYGTFEQLKKNASTFTNNPKDMHQMRGAVESGFFVPSQASDKYRSAVATYLSALRKHVENQPYGKVVVGYRFISGYDGQWGQPYEAYGYDKSGTHVFDFSKPAVEKFREFLKEKYNSDDALRKAWNNPQITLADAAVPPANIRDFDQMADKNSYILDPAKYQQLIDFREFTAKKVAELLISYGKTIKESGEKPVITLAYYPDVVETGSGGGGTHRGNELVYRSPYIDAVGGPTYDAREIGQPGRTNVLLNSTVANGKIHLNEMDHRLFTVVRRNYSGNMVFDSPRKTISILRREYMRQMCSGNGSWLFDMGLGWYNDPLISAIIGNCYDVFQSVLELDRESIAKMAIYLTPSGKAVQADGRRGSIPKELTAQPIIAAAQAGLPIDQYQLADLGQTAGNYKVFYFPFAYGLSSQEVQAIEALKKDGNILVFGFAAGYAENSMSLANVEKLTGFSLKIQDGMDLTVKFEPGHILTENIAGHFLGSGGNTYMNKGLPGIYIDDPAATVLAKFVKTDLPGVAVKSHANWTGIYLGFMGSATPRLLHNIGRFAKLDIYNQPGDTMYFNKSLIAIHAASDGLKTIQLPQSAEVFSLWDQQNAGTLQTIRREMKTGDNALYRIK